MLFILFDVSIFMAVNCSNKVNIMIKVNKNYYTNFFKYVIIMM